MNSRERVIAAIKNQGVDRTPYDFWAENATLERLYDAVGHRDFERLLNDLHVDIRHIDAVTPEAKNRGSFYQNYWGERFVYKQTPWGPVREDLPGALHSVLSLEEIKNFTWPSVDQFDYANLRTLCEMHRDYAIMYGFADIWQRPALVRGMENALLDLVLHPDWSHYLSRKFTDFYIADYSRAHQASGGRIDIFLIISDLGGQQGPLISLKMFDEFVAPYLQELTDHIHHLGAYVMFHSCGMIFPLIERLIAIGIDILDPIQPVSESMRPESLRAKFKNKICFHGGIDIQNVLPYGTPADVAREVRKYAEAFGGDGGYICCPAHLWQPDVPPQNIVAFYNTLTE